MPTPLRVRPFRAYSHGTWIEGEECSYPSGAIHAGRRARALCPDGKYRIVNIGVADTYWTIPASCRIGARRVRGFISVEPVSGPNDMTTPDTARLVRFHPVTKKGASERRDPRGVGRMTDIIRQVAELKVRLWDLLAEIERRFDVTVSERLLEEILAAGEPQDVSLDDIIEKD